MSEKVWFTLSNGQRLWMKTVTGEVLDQTKSIRTEVRQGEPTILSKDVIIPGHISSHKVVEHEIWIRTDGGEERLFQIGHVDLAARPGHVITLLGGGPVGAIYAYRNHSTNVTSSDVMALRSDLRAWKLKIGAFMCIAKWTFWSACIPAVITFVRVSGDFRDKAEGAAAIAMIGAVVGVFLGAFVGLNFGPEKLAMKLTGEINDAARSLLLSVKPH